MQTPEFERGLERLFEWLPHERIAPWETISQWAEMPSLAILLPISLRYLGMRKTLVLGTLAASFGGTLALGHSTFDKVVGFGVALATGFVAAGLALILIYRIFPPIRLNWGSIARASATAAAGISVISALLVLYLNVGANFQKHYSTSGLAALILVAVWLFLSNVLLLVGYKIAQETK